MHADPVAHRIPGGIGTYVTRLVDALAARADPGVELELLLSRSAGRLPQRWDDLPVRRAALPLRPLYAGWNGLRLPRSGRGADVVHATNLVLPPGGGALVTTVHDLNVELYPALVPQPWRALYRRGLQLAVRSSGVLCTSTLATAAALRERYDVAPERLVLTPFGSGLDVDAPRDDAGLAHLGVRAPYVLTVGTLEPRKNQPTLIRALAAAPDLAGHQLVIAGVAGWGADDVRAAAHTSGCAERIVFAEGVSAPVLASLYAGADVFALPSRYEGFGFPLLEALCFGVPSVASTDPALVEVAGGAAHHVDADDADALTSVLQVLAGDDAERARLRRAGPARAAGFSWDHTAEATLAAYRLAAERRHG
jgi:glycosyltransferase involved in cell wall biosynthesis